MIHSGVTKGHVPRAPKFRGAANLVKNEKKRKFLAPKQFFNMYPILQNIITTKIKGARKFGVAIYRSYAAVNETFVFSFLTECSC